MGGQQSTSQDHLIKNFRRSKGFCSSCTGHERVTGATSQPTSLSSTSTPSSVSLTIVNAYNLSFRLDQLPRSLVCIVWATADGQKFQNSTKNSKPIKVICHFSRLTERLSSAETISRFWIISWKIGFLTILFRFSQCWNQASDSGEEGESIDELIDSVTDMKKAAVIQYLTPLPNYWVQIVKLPNP